MNQRRIGMGLSARLCGPISSSPRRVAASAFASFEWEFSMRTAIVFCCLCVAIGAVSPAEAKPGGCLKYGAAGAVAGHIAGHHAVKGAIAGCIAGMVRRHEYKKQMREQQGAH
jgi:hypothetical protein